MDKPLTDYLEQKYAPREDQDNMYGVGISDAEFRSFIIDYLLGPNWYVADPLGPTQVNEEALYQVLMKYSRRFQKEYKNWKKWKNNK